MLCPTTNHSCPEGYTCGRRAHLLARRAIRPTAAAAAPTAGRSAGSSAPGPSVAPSTRTRVCTDGTNETIAWTGDFFDVTAGVAAPLTAFYYCDWNLDVSATGTSTLIRAGTSCSAPDPNVSTTNFTWTGQAFTLTTSNGRNATLDASLPYSYTTRPGSGSCMMHFTGTLTKS